VDRCNKKSAAYPAPRVRPATAALPGAILPASHRQQVWVREAPSKRLPHGVSVIRSSSASPAALG